MPRFVGAALPQRTTPIAAERSAQLKAAWQREQKEREAESRRASKGQFETGQAAVEQQPLKWGTREVRLAEIERVRREIEERKK